MFNFEYNKKDKNNLDNTDTNLLQGEVFLEYENIIKKMTEPNLPLLEETSSPNLGSIIENYTDSENVSQDDNSTSNLYSKFQAYIHSYHTQHRNIMQNILNKKKLTPDYFNSIQNTYNDLTRYYNYLMQSNDYSEEKKNEIKTQYTLVSNSMQNLLNISGSQKMNQKTYNDYVGEMEYQKLNFEAHRLKYIFNLAILILIVVILVSVIGKAELSWWLPPVLIIIFIVAIYYIIQYFWLRDIL